jgi:hypothetical protein
VTDGEWIAWGNLVLTTAALLDAPRPQYNSSCDYWVVAGAGVHVTGADKVEALSNWLIFHSRVEVLKTGGNRPRA